jgi:hypothetical protein
MQALALACKGTRNSRRKTFSPGGMGMLLVGGFALIVLALALVVVWEGAANIFRLLGQIRHLIRHSVGG